MKPFDNLFRSSLVVWVMVVFISLATLQDIPENASDILQDKSYPWLDASDPIPTMAYYYIWFDTKSWNRAKIDYPLLGRYSSDDREVMQQHIKWAKEVGIDGFIISWKSTYSLDRRLEILMDVAAQENFKLWIIYQGLDFDRNPLPVDRIVNDLGFFLKRYAEHPAFDMYDLPVVIWSGTWMFSPQDIQHVTDTYEDWLYLLGSERNVEDYQKVASFFDGNAYYWASVNPDTFPRYQEKLSEMGKAIHEHGGLWVAPAAPGFDARLVGGSSIVERNGHQTLLRQMDAALASSPDVIGIISWNEFSENTHIEPSQNYGSTALDALGERQITLPPVISDFDSSAPGTTQRNDLNGVYILATFALFILASLALLVLRAKWRVTSE
jgi:Glycosyl hydrolase family 99